MGRAGGEPVMAPDELRLESDELRLVILPEIGARVHRIRAYGHDLLRTPDDPATHRVDPFFWGAYPLAPWCNRASAGRHELAGRVANLRPNFADGSAIHGLVSSAAWSLRDDGSLHVEGGGDDTWPWPFEVILEPAVDGATVTLEYRLLNRSDAPMPAGLGLHPWFRRPLELRVPAERVYERNTDSTPRPRPVRGSFDLRRRATPAADLDATWTGLAETAVDLAWPSDGIAARLAVAAPRLLVAVATPSNKDAAAVEPQTHGPDPLRRLARGEPDAPTLLPPGGGLRLRLEMTVRRLDGRS